MSQPTGGDLFVSKPLTNISVAYMNEDSEFIASRVFPSVPSDVQGGLYYTYNKGDWFRTAAQRRAPATESAGTGWNVGTDNYFIPVDAVHKDVADQDRSNVADDSPFNLDRDATMFVTRDMLLRREKDWVSAYFGTGKWATTDQTGVAAAPGANQFLQWNNTASTPIEDIEEQRIILARTTGRKPNFLVIGPEVESVFKNHPQFIERIKYSERGVVTRELIAALLDLNNVLVPTVVENTAEEGAADNFQFVHGKGALLGHAAPNPGKMIPSAGYTFEWTGYIGAQQRGSRIKKFRMEELAADRVEAEHAYQYKQVSGDLAIFYASAVA